MLWYLLGYPRLLSSINGILAMLRNVLLRSVNLSALPTGVRIPPGARYGSLFADLPGSSQEILSEFHWFFLSSVCSVVFRDPVFYEPGVVVQFFHVYCREDQDDCFHKQLLAAKPQVRSASPH